MAVTKKKQEHRKHYFPYLIFRFVGTRRSKFEWWNEKENKTIDSFFSFFPSITSFKATIILQKLKLPQILIICLWCFGGSQVLLNFLTVFLIRYLLVVWPTFYVAILKTAPFLNFDQAWLVNLTMYKIVKERSAFYTTPFLSYPLFQIFFISYTPTPKPIFTTSFKNSGLSQKFAW